MENLKKSINKARFSRKQALTTTALILLLASIVAGASSFTVQAAKDVDQQSYSFIAVTPNPVGKDQTLLILAWVADPLPSASTGIGQFRTGYKVTIARPDGQVETKTGLKPDYLGGAVFTYIPTLVGDYNFTFTYPSETIYYQWDNVNNKPLNPQNNFTVLGSSATDIVHVQANPVQTQFQVPFPNQYWTRPINAQNYYWSQISGNWLMAAWNSTSRAFDNNAAFIPEGTLSNSPHILYTFPLTYGGLAGGIYNNVPYYAGASYEMYFAPPIIISGRLFYTTIQSNEPRGVGGPFPNLGTACVDLNTGQTLFVIPNATMQFGQIMNFPGVNQMGTQAYLWGTWGAGSTQASAPGTITLFDPWTGNSIITLGNYTGGSVVFGNKGEIIKYRLFNNATTAAPQWLLEKWNSTLAIESYQPTGTGTTSIDYSWRPYTRYLANMSANIDANRGIMWQVSALNVNGYSMTPFLQQGATFMGNNILTYQTLGTGGSTNMTSPIGLNITAYDMTNGQMSGPYVITPAPGLPNTLNGIAAFENIWEFNGHLYNFNHYTMQWVQYDIVTGQETWVSAPAHNSYGYFGQANSIIEAYGLLLATGFDGYAYGYDINNGTTVWEYYAGDAGTLVPYGHYTFYDGINVIDGKVILLPNEHGSGIEPLYQNLTTTVLDARTGKLIWQTLGYFNKPAIADGIMVSQNNYDNLVYAFGKGPSQTTVEAPLTAVNTGSGMVIQGTVTDQSVGALAIAKETGMASIPAISDKDQADWMAQLYMQQVGRLKQTAKGVPVLIRAIDSTGAVAAETTVTSDVLGNFAYQWTPTTPGLYSIVADFLGSESYWGSNAETHVVVQSAPSSGSPTPTPSPVVTPPTSPTVTPTNTPSPSTPTGPGGGLSATDLLLIGVAVIVVIIVVAAAVILRRRK